MVDAKGEWMEGQLEGGTSDATCVNDDALLQIDDGLRDGGSRYDGS